MKLEMAINNNRIPLIRYGNLFPHPSELGIFDGLDTFLKEINIPNYDKKSLNFLYYKRSKDKVLSKAVSYAVDVYGKIKEFPNFYIVDEEGNRVCLSAREPIVDNNQNIIVDGLNRRISIEDSDAFDRFTVSKSNEFYYTIRKDGIKYLIKSIITKYGFNWKKMSDTYHEKYDMLSPFKIIVDDSGTNSLESSDMRVGNSRSEEELRNSYSENNSDSKSEINNSSQHDVDAISENGSSTKQNVGTGKYQGFNSSDFSDVDQNVVAENNNNNKSAVDTLDKQSSENKSYAGTLNKDGSISNDNSISDSSESSGTYERDSRYHRDTARYGNIGNRSSQELIEEERGLWVWNIYNQIFEDIDKTLTMGIY